MFLTTAVVEVQRHPGPLAEAWPPVLVNVQKNRQRLIAEEDTDEDTKITRDDTYVKGKGRGDKRFWLVATNGKHYEVVGTYSLSNLLQELSLAYETGLEVAAINFERIFESPVQRISRLIRGSRTRRLRILFQDLSQAAWVV